jgi:ribosomal protein L14E/L6E/L27E
MKLIIPLFLILSLTACIAQPALPQNGSYQLIDDNGSVVKKGVINSVPDTIVTLSQFNQETILSMQKQEAELVETINISNNATALLMKSREILETDYRNLIRTIVEANNKDFKKVKYMKDGKIILKQ